MASTNKPPVFLLDSMGFIFRAYHAMQRQRPMTTRTGLPTAAIFVFVNMIQKLRRDFSPEFCAAVFDLSGPVFRDEQAKGITTLRKWNAKLQDFEDVDYAGYKANRAETPPDLIQQIPYIRRVLEAFRIPILQAEGFEADDVIGTLAREAAATGHDVFVVSADKDMMQLVNERVKILNPAKDNLILDSEKVREVLGVGPEQVIDVMALRGDTVDNIPGAPGIGDKGSVELIQQFGSVEATIEHAAEVKRKSYRESLEHNRDTILLSKELVTIDQHVPLPLDLDAMRTQQPDIEAARTLFTELEFTSMLKELGSAPETVQAELILAPTVEQFAALFQQARSTGLALVAGTATAAPIKTEEAEEPAAQKSFSMLDAMEAAAPLEKPIFKLGISTREMPGMIASLTDELRAILADKTIPKQVHDLKQTLRALEAEGVTLAGPADDAMLLSYLINPTHSSHRLSDIAARFSATPLREGGEALLAEGAHALSRLIPQLRKDVSALNALKVYEEMDLPLVPVLKRMEDVGVRIDVPMLNILGDRIEIEAKRVAEEVFAIAGTRFNINSPKQLGDVLFNQMNLPRPTKGGKGKVISTAQDVLEGLAEHNEAPRKVLEYRQLTKLKSTYLDSLPLLVDADSRIHTTFNQAGTATGRLSSTNPNLQNIPVRTELGREIRAAFVARPGNLLISADYSQIELRLMAHFSEDPLLVKAYSTDQDIHTLTASEVFGIPVAEMTKEIRNRAKAVNFGIVYGISPFGLAAQLGIPQHEARHYIETYFARYAGVKEYIDRLLEETRRNQCAHTLFGRVRPIPDIESRNPNLRGFAERTAINTPLQGTASDLIKLAMIVIDRRLREEKFQTQMTLQIHDELLFDAPQEEVEAVSKIVKQEMEGVIQLKVPIVADIGIGPNWRDMR
jgi:DNA polymerase-1